MKGLAKDAKIVRLLGGVAAGTDGSRQALPEIDMKGFNACLIVLQIGTVTTNGIGTLRAKNSDTTATYGAGTIDDIATAIGATSNTHVMLDIREPLERFIRADYQRTVANVVIEGAFAILYDAHNEPVTQPTGTVETTVVGPAPAVA